MSSCFSFIPASVKRVQTILNTVYKIYAHEGDLCQDGISLIPLGLWKSKILFGSYKPQNIVFENINGIRDFYIFIQVIRFMKIRIKKW